MYPRINLMLIAYYIDELLTSIDNQTNTKPRLSMCQFDHLVRQLIHQFSCCCDTHNLWMSFINFHTIYHKYGQQKCFAASRMALKHHLCWVGTKYRQSRLNRGQTSVTKTCQCFFQCWFPAFKFFY